MKTEPEVARRHWLSKYLDAISLFLPDKNSCVESISRVCGDTRKENEITKWMAAASTARVAKEGIVYKYQAPQHKKNHQLQSILLLLFPYSYLDLHHHHHHGYFLLRG
jgi:hypothetical protein